MNVNTGFSIITVTRRLNMIERILANYINQEFENKELIIIINDNQIEIGDFEVYTKIYKDIQIFKLPEQNTLGYCLNFGIDRAKNYYIAKFDDDDHYGKFYLQEMYNAFKISACHIIGKSKLNYYLEEYKELRVTKNGEENNYTNWVGGPTLCFTKDLYKIVKFKNVTIGEDVQFLHDCRIRGYKIYSTSRNNHILFRSNNVNQHTWKVRATDLIKSTTKVKDNVTFDESFRIIDDENINIVE